jgi:hypothetical protein
MENQNKRSFQRGTASAGRSQSSSRPIRTTASYMHTEKKAEPAPAEENARRSKKPRRNRKKQNENVTRKNIPWKQILISAGVLVVVLAILAVIFGTEPKVVHQMPKVTPPESVEESV